VARRDGGHAVCHDVGAQLELAGSALPWSTTGSPRRLMGAGMGLPNKRLKLTGLSRCTESERLCPGEHCISFINGCGGEPCLPAA